MNYGRMTSATMTTGGMTNAAMANGSMGNRDQVTQWQGTHNWDDIDKAVDDENQLKVAARFLSPYPLPGATSALRGVVPLGGDRILKIPQSEMIPLIEIGVQFALTEAQVNDEAHWQMGVTLAHRAGALLGLAEDVVIFRGNDGVRNNPDPVFQTVETDGSDAGIGLVNAPPQGEVIPVFPVDVPDANDPKKNRYGENTFGAVARAFARLQEKHYGRCALVLHTNVYADTYEALKGTLAVPAERIKGLVSEHFYVSSALPEFTGILVALDGDTMDLVVGQDPITTFTQRNNSQYIFRLYERFALRLKDPTAVVKLEFARNNP